MLKLPCINRTISTHTSSQLLINAYQDEQTINVHGKQDACAPNAAFSPRIIIYKNGLCYIFLNHLAKLCTAKLASFFWGSIFISFLTYLIGFLLSSKLQITTSTQCFYSLCLFHFPNQPRNTFSVTSDSLSTHC